MDETTEIIKSIRATQLDANEWRADMRVEGARIEAAIASLRKDEEDSHKNIETIKTELTTLRIQVDKVTAINIEKISQISEWKNGLWSRAMGILAILHAEGAGIIWFLKSH